jgi:hypothetical protein
MAMEKTVPPTQRDRISPPGGGSPTRRWAFGLAMVGRNIESVSFGAGRTGLAGQPQIKNGPPAFQLAPSRIRSRRSVRQPVHDRVDPEFVGLVRLFDGAEAQA